MQMDAGLDTGPILAKRVLPILPLDSAGTLTEKLSFLAAETLIELLPVYIHGDLSSSPQDSEQATYAPQLKKENGRLDVRLDATLLERQVRAYTPWPGSFFIWQQTTIKVLASEALDVQSGKPAGTLDVLDHSPVIHCGKGILVLRMVQLPGKRPMSGRDFLNGVREFSGMVTS
jgi:methionyl-tRNA formyltransferase